MTDGAGGPRRALDPEEFDRLLSQTRASLSALRRTAPDEEPVEGAAEGLDGLVRVRTTPAGQVAELSLDPRVLRVPLQDLAEAIRDAVNAALAAGRPQLPAEVADVPVVDLQALQGKVEELQTDGVRQLARFSDAVAEAIQQLKRP